MVKNQNQKQNPKPKSVTFESDNGLLDCVRPTSVFVSTEFANRVSPQFMTAKDFVIHSSAPFHRVKIWIRSWPDDFILLDEQIHEGTCEYRVEFNGFFSTFNTESNIEFIIFDKLDRKIRATLCYRDYHFCIVPQRGTKRREFMVTGPKCKNPMYNEQYIYVDGYHLVVEPGENCVSVDRVTGIEIH